MIVIKVPPLVGYLTTENEEMEGVAYRNKPPELNDVEDCVLTVTCQLMELPAPATVVHTIVVWAIVTEHAVAV